MTVALTRPAVLKDVPRDGTRHPASATPQASRTHPSPGHTLAGSPPGNLRAGTRPAR